MSPRATSIILITGQKNSLTFKRICPGKEYFGMAIVGPTMDNNMNDYHLYRQKRKFSMKDYIDYGPVLITKGPHKGQIGYYDDDEDNQLIIYPNVPSYCTVFYKVRSTAVTSTIPTKRLADRWAEIDQELYTNACTANLSTEEETALLHERILCSDLLTERHFLSMQKMQDQRNTEIFISHSSKDLIFSRALATDLMNAGFSVFLDDWSIDVGERIFEKINVGLSESKALIMVISSDYLDSVCCKDEWGAFYGKALHDNMCVIYPIIIDDSEPPMLLSQIKYLKINTTEYPSQFSMLLKAFSKQFNKE